MLLIEICDVNILVCAILAQEQLPRIFSQHLQAEMELQIPKGMDLWRLEGLTVGNIICEDAIEVGSAESALCNLWATGSCWPSLQVSVCKGLR